MVTRQEAIQNLFRWIQSKYGNVDKLMDTSLHVQVRHDGQIITHDLERLFRHEILALHIKNYLDPTYAQHLGKELADMFVAAKKKDINSTQAKALLPQARNWTTSHLRGYPELSDVYTLGHHVPYNVAISDPLHDKAKTEYYHGVLRELRQRKRCMRTVAVDSSPMDSSSSSSSSSSTWNIPQLHPMDQLRLDLDETWPAGAGLYKEKIEYSSTTNSANSNRQNNYSPSSSPSSSYSPMGAGLPRIMIGPTRWRQGFIHVDELNPLNIHRGLFSANIFLQLPPKVQTNDGNLLIWPLNVRNKVDWYRNAHLLSKLVSSDVMDQYELRKALQHPVQLHLDPGDLVLLCVQRPHAAMGFEQGIRVSYQSFLQYTGSDSRILLEI